MANWNQKKQLLAIGGATLAVCLATLGGVFYAQTLVEEVDAQIDAKRQEIQAAEAKIKLIPATEDEVIVLRENLENYVKILPDSKELIAFVRMIDDFERQTGVQGNGLVPVRIPEGKGPQRFQRIAYTYDARGTLWQFLKLVNLIESYDRFVAITDFAISSGGGGRDEELVGGEVVHTMRVTLQTYTYNSQGVGKEVAIANYDKRKNELSEEIWKRIRDVRIEKYDYREKVGRRDIFVDPRISGEPGTVETMEVQKQLLERYVGDVAHLLAVAKKLRDPETSLFEQYGLEKQLREGLAKVDESIEADVRLVTFAPFKLKWATLVNQPLDQVRAQVAAVDPARIQDPYLPKPELENLLAAMLRDLNAGQLQDAKGRYDAAAARLKVPASDERHGLAVQAKALHVKAATALEFQGMDLRLDGVVVNHGGRSGVLLNGEIYEEGEFIAEDLLLKQVEEEQVWFVFRGLTLVRTM